MSLPCFFSCITLKNNLLSVGKFEENVLNEPGRPALYISGMTKEIVNKQQGIVNGDAAVFLPIFVN